MPRGSAWWSHRIESFLFLSDFIITHLHRKNILGFHPQFSKSFLNGINLELTYMSRNMGTSYNVLPYSQTHCCPLLLSTEPLWLLLENFLWSAYTSSLQRLSTVAGCQEAMGRIMTKVLGTLSFSSHCIPSSRFSFADHEAFPQEVTECGYLAGQPIAPICQTGSHHQWVKKPHLQHPKHL